MEIKESKKLEQPVQNILKKSIGEIPVSQFENHLNFHLRNELNIRPGTWIECQYNTETQKFIFGAEETPGNYAFAVSVNVPKELMDEVIKSAEKLQIEKDLSAQEIQILKDQKYVVADLFPQKDNTIYLASHCYNPVEISLENLKDYGVEYEVEPSLDDLCKEYETSVSYTDYIKKSIQETTSKLVKDLFKEGGPIDAETVPDTVSQIIKTLEDNGLSFNKDASGELLSDIQYNTDTDMLELKILLPDSTELPITAPVDCDIVLGIFQEAKENSIDENYWKTLPADGKIKPEGIWSEVFDAYENRISLTSYHKRNISVYELTKLGYSVSVQQSQSVDNLIAEAKEESESEKISTDTPAEKNKTEIGDIGG